RRSSPKSGGAGFAGAGSGTCERRLDGAHQRAEAPALPAPGAGAVSLYELDRAHVVHPHAVVGRPSDPIVWARGEGARLWDTEGNEYVDGTCGLWQCAVGHGRAELAD